MPVCSVYEKGMVFARCRFSHDAGLCRNCGYLCYADVDQTLKLKPSVLLRAYPKTAGDWLILRSLRSKMCLSPSPRRFWDRLLAR